MNDPCSDRAALGAKLGPCRSVGYNGRANTPRIAGPCKAITYPAGISSPVARKKISAFALLVRGFGGGSPCE